MTGTHYVDNKLLLAELIKHKKALNKFKRSKLDSSHKPKLSPYIGEAILLIAKKLANRPNFINYPFKEEMIGDGIENCLMYIDNFDPKKSNNPFAYITQIIFYAFLRRISKEKKHLYTKHKLIQNSMIFDEMMEQDENADHATQSYFENEHMNDFVKNYEKGIDEKKREKKAKALEKLFVEEQKTPKKKVRKKK